MLNIKLHYFLIVMVFVCDILLQIITVQCINIELNSTGQAKDKQVTTPTSTTTDSLINTYNGTVNPLKLLKHQINYNKRDFRKIQSHINNELVKYFNKSTIVLNNQPFSTEHTKLPTPKMINNNKNKINENNLMELHKTRTNNNKGNGRNRNYLDSIRNTIELLTINHKNSINNNSIINHHKNDNYDYNKLFMNGISDENKFIDHLPWRTNKNSLMTFLKIHQNWLNQNHQNRTVTDKQFKEVNIQLNKITKSLRRRRSKEQIFETNPFQTNSSNEKNRRDLFTSQRRFIEFSLPEAFISNDFIDTILNLSSSSELAEGRKKKKKKIKKKKFKKFLIPLLLAYKLKFLTLIPVLIAGLTLLVSTTGMAGFFFALFTAVMSLRLAGGNSVIVKDL